MPRYKLEAKNTATTSDNKIHDDAVAKGLGFSGGLVPGVDVYAYLCHLPAERWGEAWLASGTMSGRFLSPVYDGDTVTVESEESGDSMVLRLHDSAGALCAEGSAAVSRLASPESGDVSLESFPMAALPARDERPPASVGSLVGVLGSLELGFHAGKTSEYLDDVREHLDLFRTLGFAHPAWLLRQANYVLSSNVKLGPWIHVSSDSTHLSAVRDGERVSVRAKVAEVYERKGHRIVDLDVLFVADERPAMYVKHSAIFEPRQVSQSSSA